MGRSELLPGNTTLAQGKLWKQRQQVLKGWGIHDGRPQVMAYFKLSLSTHNWDRAFFIASHTLILSLSFSAALLVLAPP